MKRAPTDPELSDALRLFERVLEKRERPASDDSPAPPTVDVGKVADPHLRAALSRAWHAWSAKN